MEIRVKLHVYRVDQTKKGEWVQCRSLATFPDGQTMNLAVLRPVAEALSLGMHDAVFHVRERDGNLALEVKSVAPVVSEVRKAS